MAQDGSVDEDAGLRRCSWCGSDPLYVAYHDAEWGVPQRDGRALFELLCLEGQQAGLAWITVLRKRATMRAAYEDFVPERLALWGEEDMARTLADPGVIRHRGKVAAVVQNARSLIALGGREAFSAFVWDSVGGAPVQPGRAATGEVPARTPVAAALSKRLAKAGFKFCGPVTVYAFMQAAGLVNDHVAGCFRQAQLGGAAPAD